MVTFVILRIYPSQNPCREHDGKEAGGVATDDLYYHETKTSGEAMWKALRTVRASSVTVEMVAVDERSIVGCSSIAAFLPTDPLLDICSPLSDVVGEEGGHG